ncbi:MAG: alpha/beta fold hydrolase [Deltaproteobacteria bacterium]|jgi:medium-chain acyl-[acyl-carrier-protein] hydrolase|nr:alpha/beta fold hydrolase [Deltaproteobacteria bacterium]
MNRPTLFILAHAGGSAPVYQRVLGGLAERFSVAPLELAGHGCRLAEDLNASLEDMLRDLVALVGRSAAPPTDGQGYFIFGHSLGGLLGFLLADALSSVAAWGPPEHLLVSSACAPGLHRVKPGLLQLSDADLWRASADYFGSVHEEATVSEELRLLFAPILRADLAAVENYRPPAFAPLRSRLTLLYAEDDIVGLEDLERWAPFCSETPRVEKRPGGHFHPLTHPAGLEKLILDLADDSTSRRDFSSNGSFR